MNNRVRKISVLGANGTIGVGVTGILAAFSGAEKIYVVTRSIDKSKDAIVRAASSVKSDAIRDVLVPCTYDELDICIPESDWIFEAVSEAYETKIGIYKKISRYLDKNTLVTTGTSGLSINKLSDVFNDETKKNFFGTHFFNPPYKMLLCEVIPNDNTDVKILVSFCKWLEHTLLRKVVKVKDKPGFAGNRIGFQFINEAAQYAEKFSGEGGIDYIDSILGTFTGRAMPPLMTLDFVGLDVHKAIVDNIYLNTLDIERETFKLPAYISQLIEKKCYGAKSGIGLYKSVKEDDGSKKLLVYDVLANEYRENKKYEIFVFNEMKNKIRDGEYCAAFKKLCYDDSKESEVCRYFLLKYISYSCSLIGNVVESLGDCDTVMATGFNWIPPSALIQLFGGRYETIRLMKEHGIYISDSIKSIDYNEKSIDYRKYLRAR